MDFFSVSQLHLELSFFLNGYRDFLVTAYKKFRLIGAYFIWISIRWCTKLTELHYINLLTIRIVKLCNVLVHLLEIAMNY